MNVPRILVCLALVLLVAGSGCRAAPEAPAARATLEPAQVERDQICALLA